MRKRRREADSDDITPTPAYNTVFIDTNLDTHLALIVSDSDTVSDLKGKVMFEHPQCFPRTGEIKIHALKVKRKGHFYHLSDSMFVKSAFEGTKKNWFLSVDASSSKQHTQNRQSYKPHASNQLPLLCYINAPSDNRYDALTNDLSIRPSIDHASSSSLQPLRIEYTKQKVPDSCREVSKSMEMGVKHLIDDDHCKDLSSDADRRSYLRMKERDDVISEGNKILETAFKHNDDNSKDDLLEKSLQIGPPAKKKRKVKKHIEDISSLETVGPPNYLVNAGGEVSNDPRMGNKDVFEELRKISSLDTRSESGLHLTANVHEGTFMNDKSKSRISNLQGSYSPEEASPSRLVLKKMRVVESEEHNKNPLEENETLFSSSIKGICRTLTPENPQQDNMKAASDNLLVEPPESDHLGTSLGTKKKSKKGKKSKAIPHDEVANVVPFSMEDVSEERSTKEEVEISRKNLSTLSDVKVSPPPMIEDLPTVSNGISHRKQQNNVPDDHTSETNQTDEFEPDVNAKEPVSPLKMPDTDVFVESVTSSRRLKKWVKKADAKTDQDASGMDHARNIVGDDTRKNENTFFHTSLTGVDIDGDNGSGKEAEFFSPLTKTDSVQENAEHTNGKSRKKVKKNRSSTAKSLQDFPIKEQGNEVESLQPNQINRIQEDAVNMDQKSKNKTKKNENAHTNLLMEEQEVGLEELAASNDKMRETDIPSKKKKKDRSSKTSLVNQSTRSELELEKNAGGSLDQEQTSKKIDLSEDEIVANDHVEVSKSEGGDINFKHYFVPGQPQEKVPTAGKVKEARRSEREIRDEKKKSHIRNSSSIQLQESSSKDDRNEVMLHSTKKSSKILGNGVRASLFRNNNQMQTPCEARQPDTVDGSSVIRSVPAYPKGDDKSSDTSISDSKKKGSLRTLQNRGGKKRKSSSDHYKSTFSKNRGDVVNNGQRKKSLLTTPGSIFKDNSSESSADENGTVNSDASTRTPSDNSSSSGYSEGGSVSSPETPTNESHGAESKEADGRILKPHSSSSKPISMDMILRNSSGFKKAKLTATRTLLEDSESQPVDFVPDSQVNP